MSALELAMQLLAGNAIPFPFEDLPKRYDDPLWDKIEERYNLSLPQVSALKNEVYAPPSDAAERGREFARRLLSYFNIPPQSALSSTSLEGPLRRLPHGSDAQYMPSAPRSSPPTNTFASDLPTGSAIHVVSSGQAPNMQCNNGDNGVNGVEMVEVDTLRRRPPRNLKIPGGNEK